MKKLFLALLLVFSSVNLLSCEKDEDGGGQKKAAQKSILNPTSEYIAVFGDIQCLTASSNRVAIYKHSVDWVQEQIDKGYKIQSILHTGDITANNREDQWRLFYNATIGLAENVPFFSAIGDHDYTWNDVIYIDNRLDTSFDDFVTFPLSVSKIVDYFEEGRMENIIVENYIHGQPYYFLILEFGPRPEVIDWARMYVGDHSWINFILLNHEYLESGGGLRTSNLKCKARLRNTNYLTPTELWEQLVSPYDNISWVLCGHVASLYALTYGTNDSYREVPQIQHNIQEEPYRYDNWLMLWEFPEEGDSASVFIYNTKTLKYYNDKKVLFKFKYTDNPPVSKIRDINRRNVSSKEYDISGKRLFPGFGGKQVFIREGKKYVCLKQ